MHHKFNTHYKIHGSREKSYQCSAMGLLFALLFLIGLPTVVFGANDGFFARGEGGEPTFIKSDKLHLKGNSRFFVYTGNVEVKQEDLLLTCSELEGEYNENNEITSLTAKKNVVIHKGDNIRARSEHAVYRAKDDSLVLTENPEVDQQGSILTADTITIFLSENRSQAEGNVRAKLDSASDEKKGKKKGNG